MWSGVKAMPSVWKVGKFSLSLPVSCQSVVRVTLPKVAARLVSAAWWTAPSVAWALAAAAPPTVRVATAARVVARVRVRFMGISRLGMTWRAGRVPRDQPVTRHASSRYAGRLGSGVGLGQPHPALGHDVAHVVGVVGDDVVDAEVHQGSHGGGVVTGPRDHGEAAGVRLGHHLLVRVEAEPGVAHLAVLREAVVRRQRGDTRDRCCSLDEVAAEVVDVEATQPR